MPLRRSSRCLAFGNRLPICGASPAAPGGSPRVLILNWSSPHSSLAQMFINNALRRWSHGVCPLRCRCIRQQPFVQLLCAFKLHLRGEFPLDSQPPAFTTERVELFHSPPLACRRKSRTRESVAHPPS